MTYIGEPEIRAKAVEFEKKLIGTKYRIEENMYRNYMAKYVVYEDQQILGKLIIDYKSSKHTFKCRQEKMDATVFAELECIWGAQSAESEEVSTAGSVLTNKKNPQNPCEILMVYYDILKRYRHKNFDFQCFAEELAAQYSDEASKSDIRNHHADFDVLEKYYNKICVKS